MITLMAILGTVVAMVTVLVINDLRDHGRASWCRWSVGVLGTLCVAVFWTVCLLWEYNQWRNVYYWLLYWP
jgi:hypothetical protein